MQPTPSRASSEDEFTAFVHAVWPSLYRTALLMSGDHALAEDLAQTALARTYSTWHRIRDRAAAHGYARRILVNTAASWFRRRSTRRRSSAADAPTISTMRATP